LRCRVRRDRRAGAAVDGSVPEPGSFSARVRCVRGASRSSRVGSAPGFELERGLPPESGCSVILDGSFKDLRRRSSPVAHPALGPKSSGRRQPSDDAPSRSPRRGRARRHGPVRRCQGEARARVRSRECMVPNRALGVDRRPGEKHSGPPPGPRMASPWPRGGRVWRESVGPFRPGRPTPRSLNEASSGPRWTG